MRRRRDSETPWLPWVAPMLALGLWAAAASATMIPDGFGDAKLRMSVDDVRKVYPNMAVAPPAPGKDFLSHPNMQRFLLTNMAVMDLPRPVEVEFRFWKGQLWTVIVYYSGNTPSDVTNALTRMYGPPSNPVGNPSWMAPTSNLVTSQQAQWYAINDKALGRDAQEAFVASLERHGAPQKATQAPATDAPK